jgi:Tol biopolymer transport system component
MGKVAWLPDGRTILFVQASDKAGDPEWRIMRVDVTGANPSPTVLGLNALRKLSTVASAQETDMVFGRLQNAGLRSLSVSPDGSTLWLTSVVNPKYEIWALDNVHSSVR